MGYLICSKCKSYYKLKSGESTQDLVDNCNCGGKLRYIENLDIVDPTWKEATMNDLCLKCGAKNPKGSVYCNNCGNKIYETQNKSQNNDAHNEETNKTRYKTYNTRNKGTYKARDEIETGLIKTIKNELNFDNIRWSLVIPVAMGLTILEAIPINILFPLIFIGLAGVGYLFKDRTIGTKNAIVTGAISFFLGSLITGAFIFIIPMVILGVIIGAICGWIGGYLKTKF